MGLNCTVIQFTNISQTYKVYVNIEKDIRKLNFQHHALNFCLDEKLSYWMGNSLFLVFKILIYVTITSDVSYSVVIHFII